MRLRLLRHAASVVEYAGLRFLLDPMLAPAGAMDPVANSPQPRRNPLVPLPVGEAELRDILESLDAVLVTHTHRDHFDDAAAALIPKDKPILCQSADVDKLMAAGFATVLPVNRSLRWRGVGIRQTQGRHGTGEIGERLSPVSGFVLSAAGQPTVYFAGDTIFCPTVAAALADHRPDLAVLFAGAAQFLSGDPITMTAEDVAAVLNASPGLRAVAMHMEALNHCVLTRAELIRRLAEQGLSHRVLVPADGQTVDM